MVIKMEMDKQELKLHLKKMLKELKSIRGRHTELISVYVPPKYDINLIVSQLSQEISTAQNIKSKTTRKNVIASLEKVVQTLRNMKRTPKNGLAVFCGNTSEEGANPKYEIWTIEPPEPVNIKLYRCDQNTLMA